MQCLHFQEVWSCSEFWIIIEWCTGVHLFGNCDYHMQPPMGCDHNKPLLSHWTTVCQGISVVFIQWGQDWKRWESGQPGERTEQRLLGRRYTRNVLNSLVWGPKALNHTACKNTLILCISTICVILPSWKLPAHHSRKNFVWFVCPIFSITRSDTPTLHNIQHLPWNCV